MKYKAGDRVRIKSLDWYNKNKDNLSFYTDSMALCFAGEIVTIKSYGRYPGTYRIDEDEGDFLWTDEMIEGLVEEEVGLVDNLSSRWVNEFNLPNGDIFKDENGNIINATKIVLEKKKKEYNKGTKVRHKTKGMVETIVGVCKIKYMGALVDGVIYEGNDTNTGEPMTFVRVKEDFENNFEVC